MEAEVERLRKKVENYPSPSSYNRLAELLIGNGQVGDAESICKRSIRDFPRNGQAYVFLAEIERGRGRPEEAKGQLHRAVQNDRRCAPAFILLAELCQLEGSVTQAVEHLQTALRIRPTDEATKQKLTALQTGAHRAMPASAPVALGSDSGVVDLSSTATGLTSIVNQHQPPTGRVDAAGPTAPTAGRPSSPTQALDHFAHTEGVRCAIIADQGGRCVATKHLPNGLDDLIAALAMEIASIGNQALQEIGAGAIQNWSIQTDQAQILSFNEQSQLSLLAIADADVKIAMLELRARQAILDLGVSS